MAATITIAFIVSGLVKAAVPLATPLDLANLGSTSITLATLQVAGKEVLSSPVTRVPSPGDGGPSNDLVQGVALEPGRPVEVRASLVGAGPPTASCRLEARPTGACLIKARFHAPTDLRCEFECKTEAAKE